MERSKSSEFNGCTIQKFVLWLCTTVVYLYPLLIRSDSIPKDAVPAHPSDLGSEYGLNQDSTPPRLGSLPPNNPVTFFLEHLRTLPGWQ